VIQAEVRRLVEEVERLQTRVAKLDAHFKIAQEDVDQIITSAGKIARRGTRNRPDGFFDPVAPQISAGIFRQSGGMTFRRFMNW